jgi:DNA recombination protein RmuC
LGLRNESGGLQKPDFIVLLPDNRAIIIDSKVPLTGYERLNAAANEEERAVFARQFLRDVRAHIDGLAGKQYQDNEKLLAHDCVLMFVPVEGALAAALSIDSELFPYAWKRRVVLVSPSILLLSMQTVHSMWRYELQERNAKEIARLAGELLDKISMSLGDLNTVREKLAAAMSAHDEAVKRLSTGRGNALSIGERIKILGVKTKRSTPAMLIEGGAIAISDGHESVDGLAELPAEATARNEERPQAAD